MMLSKFSLVRVTVIAIALGVANMQSANAIDIAWVTAGTSNWNTGANWLTGLAPSSTLEEVGVINNGGTATLAGPIAQSTGGVALGQLAAESGTLTINSGGVFTSVANGTVNGVVTVGAAGTGTLNISGTGSLSAPGLNIGGVAASQANFSGNAVVTIGGPTTVSRGLRITGPSVNYSGTGAVTFNGNAVYTPVITAATHSAVKTTGAATLGGTLAVQFSGVTPAVGNSWNLVDAASISGNFANAAIGSSITVTGAPAPAIGSAYRLRNVAGGNGRQVQVALEALLVLRVNRDTGELSIRNPFGAAVTQLDGYTITSPTVGSLLPAYKGISGAPAGNAGWEKAPTNSVTGLAEFKPAGTFDVSSAATNVSLGTGFSKTAVASQGLGVNGENLTFSYHTFGGAVVNGQVEYIGTQFLNNIALIVNTTTGQATLKNDTITSQTIDGYAILSSTSALNGGTWTSLADRPGTFPNWQESPPTTSVLSETNPVGPTTLSVGQSISLGNIGDFSSAAAQAGLSMKFILGNETAFRLATISFTSGAGQAGDYNGDSRVDGADFLVWQRGGSPTPNSAADLATWRTNYGAGGSTAASAAVPEPGACALMVAAFAGVALRGRRRRVSVPADQIPVDHAPLGGKREMIRFTALFAAVAALLANAPTAHCAVTPSANATQPTVGTYDQSQLLDDAMVPGGTTPIGNGMYNAQAYTDNGGPLGQTFTAPATKHIYALTSVSLKGAGDSGTVIDAAGTTWALRISEVNGTALTPLKTVTGVPTVNGAMATDWFTFTITGTDAATLLPNKVYAFEVYTSAGYLGIDATQGDAAYAGGTAFNSAGPIRSFTDNTLGNLGNHGYDRTFITHFTAPAGGPGDVNNNGVANIEDYNIIRTNMEKAQPIFTNGDLDGNSYVDLNDFRRWRLAVPPEVAAQANIPEPSTAVLVVTGGLLAAVRTRRRRTQEAVLAA